MAFVPFGLHSHSSTVPTTPSPYLTHMALPGIHLFCFDLQGTDVPQGHWDQDLQ